MTTKTTVPVTITPEAAAFAAEKGYRRELQQMIEHTLQVVPGLRSIRVVKEIDWTGGVDYVNIEAVHDRILGQASDDVEIAWLDWRSNTFPLEVSMLFAMTSYYKEDYGR